MAETQSMNGERSAPLPDSIAALEHLTGLSRGSVSWLHDARVDVFLAAGQLILSSAENFVGEATLVARFHHKRKTYEIEALPSQSIWVNGSQIDKKLLSHGDVVEFGETGPLSRFRLFDANHKMHWTIDQIIDDCFAYFRTSRRPLISRSYCAVRDVVRRLAVETSIVFRLTVVLALIGLATVSYLQWQLSEQLEQSIAQRSEELEGVATALSRARDEALRPSDLTELREELGGRVTSNLERLEALERRSRAGTEVIANAASAVAFIQGAYGLQEAATNRMLRQVIGNDGIPLTNPRGQPLVSFEGDGPVAAIEFTGSGFVVDGGTLITNRHVAQPWVTEARSKALAARGHQPVLQKLIAYLPGREKPLALELIGVSSDADLAALRFEPSAPISNVLRLAPTAPRAGQEIILMGYPTGLRSMLAQSGPPFIKKLQDDGDLDFWNVANRLAADRLIWPLASRGIVGKVGEVAIVYDAETTHGGSGGPVLNLRGEVIAVNTAILPDFGGSNLGIPIEKVRALLKKSES